MKVLFITNIPSPYRVEFFNELSRYCEVTVCFERENSADRAAGWKSQENYKFKSIFLSGLKVGADTAFCPGVLKYLKKNLYDYIVVCGVSTPTAIWAILHLKARKIPYYIECDGGIPKHAGGVREKIKRSIVPGAEGYFSTGKLNDEYLFQYGIPKKKIVRYPFTSYRLWEMQKDIPTAEEKQKVRKQLGMPEEKIVLSVGRFSYLNGYGKGYDVLMKASTALPKNVGVYIVGDAPTEEFLQMKAQLGLDKVHFIGFKSKQELAHYYRAADIFVLMTVSDVWGLVVNEAMSFGLPVITTDKCGAGVELIEPGINGYVVPVGDAEQLQKNLYKLLENEELCRNMAINNYNSIQAYTIENMAQTHMNFFEQGM